MAKYCECPDETVLETQGEVDRVSSCKCPSLFRRKTTWIALAALGLVASRLIMRIKRTENNIEEQVKATLPFQV